METSVGSLNEEVVARSQRAKSAMSGAVRAAVLGINDGLVTNLSLIVGLVGAGAAVREVQLAGLASLVAGACAMAIGEYISMRAQVELLERLLAEEHQAMRTNPERERRVLQETLQSHGFDPAVAQEMVLQLARAPERALNVYARAVLGVNPEELGSPWAAAVSCMGMFALGALIPLLPWFLTMGATPVALSLVLTGVAAVTSGGVLGYLTGRRVSHSALRQLLAIAVASAATFLAGWLFGVTVA